MLLKNYRAWVAICLFFSVNDLQKATNLPSSLKLSMKVSKKKCLHHLFISNLLSMLTKFFVFIFVKSELFLQVSFYNQSKICFSSVPASCWGRLLKYFVVFPFIKNSFWHWQCFTDYHDLCAAVDLTSSWTSPARLLSCGRCWLSIHPGASPESLFPPDCRTSSLSWFLLTFS